MTKGSGVSSGPMMLLLGAGNDVIAGLDFHCSISDKTIISRYYGRRERISERREASFLLR